MKLEDRGELEARAKFARGRELRDLLVAEPADRAKLVGIEGVDRPLELVTEYAMVLALVQPIAELHEASSAATELLDELSSQTGLRFFAAFDSATGQAPLADILLSTRIVLGQQVTIGARDHATHARDRGLPTDERPRGVRNYRGDSV